VIVVLGTCAIKMPLRALPPHSQSAILSAGVTQWLEVVRRTRTVILTE
jgi:hypothetical protein